MKMEFLLRCCFGWWTCSAIFLPAGMPSLAQTAPAATVAPAATIAPAATVDEALLAMASRAGAIFSGTVVLIDRQDAAGYVDVRFHIDDAIRGCPATGFYVLREWSGLWTGGSERYRAGQRLLMLLYPRGPSGISSPVNGQDGAIPIVAGGVAPIADRQGVAPADLGAGAAESLVDLRWVQAETLRTVTRPSVHALENSPVPAWRGPVAPLPSLPAPVLTALPGQIAYSAVMTLLRGGAATVPTGANVPAGTKAPIPQPVRPYAVR